MNPELVAIKVIILLFSVIIHEVAHGLMARAFGDRTAENAGRLTLNPLPHIDPIGTILVPAILLLSTKIGAPPFIFGWAKPVPINPLNFSNLRKGELFVSLAGVAANFSLALIGIALFHLLSILYPLPLLMESIFFLITINLLLGLFNLFPIPPLDGSKVLQSQLPYRYAANFAQFEQIGPYLLLGLLFVNVGNGSIISLVLQTVVGSILQLFQIG